MRLTHTPSLGGYFTNVRAGVCQQLLLLIDFQPQMSMETPVNQPNGQPQMTDESKVPTSPVVGFSDPNVTLVPPAGVTLHDQSSVIT